MGTHARITWLRRLGTGKVRDQLVFKKLHAIEDRGAGAVRGICA
jgi:hypothetical protein